MEEGTDVPRRGVAALERLRRDCFASLAPRRFDPSPLPSRSAATPGPLAAGSVWERLGPRPLVAPEPPPPKWLLSRTRNLQKRLPPASTMPGEASTAIPRIARSHSLIFRRRPRSSEAAPQWRARNDEWPPVLGPVSTSGSASSRLSEGASSRRSAGRRTRDTKIRTEGDGFGCKK